jgi:hypothetical protein
MEVLEALIMALELMAAVKLVAAPELTAAVKLVVSDLPWCGIPPLPAPLAASPTLVD